MKNRTRVLSTRTAAHLALACILVGSLQAQQSRDFDETYDLGGAGSLVLSNVSGSIRLTASDDNLVHVHATKSLKRGSDNSSGAAEALDAVKIDVSHNSDRLRIETEYTKQTRSWGGRNNHVSVRYEVQAPTGTEVRLTSVSGDITLDGISARSRVKTVSGNVTVSNVGELREAKSVSGEVEVTNAQASSDTEIGSVSGNVSVAGVRAASLSLSAVSGDVRATDSECSQAELKTVSGDVLYEGSLDRSGRYELKSHSGDVELLVPAGSGFELEAKTFSGSIESDFDLNIEEEDDDDDDDDSDRRRRRRRRRQRKSVRATVGDGSARVEASTFSGSVEIRER